MQRALEPELPLENTYCYTDSQVALFWITGLNKEWKQFVMNRVVEIRSLVPPSCWKHCPGTQNPADIPSRGASSQEFQNKLSLWLHGPNLLVTDHDMETGEMVTTPPDCLAEMRVRKEKPTTALATQTSLTSVLPCENYGCLSRLIRVTAWIQKFINSARTHKDHEAGSHCHADCALTAGDLGIALTYWIKVSQSSMPGLRDFEQWRTQFGLYQDDSGIWRCRGRLGNSDMPEQTKHPILLNRDHHLTLLIVRECHQRVMHGGVMATLTEIRSRYWIVRGRNFVGRVLHKCTICKRFQGRPYASPPVPPLPSFRVNEARPFSYTGVDFAGPLYVQPIVGSTARKVWLCLYTCCVTRAVHLDVVTDMTAQSFIQCFRRFAARRGFPTRMISDNAKTFKAASKAVTSLVEKSSVHDYLGGLGIKWAFNVERAFWWGGIFERMIQTTKRCLRKTIGGASLTFEELLTIVTEVEMTVNSRPLSYVSSEDLEEPLTPSHLLCGHRVLSLPDPASQEDTLDCTATRDDLTRRMRHLSKVLADFWKRWRSEYLLELRDMHRHFRPAKGVTSGISVGDIVVIHDENLPRGLWRLGKVEELMTGTDGNVRCATVKVASRGHGTRSIKRPLPRLYPLELRSEDEPKGLVVKEANRADHETILNASDQGQDAIPVEEITVDSVRPRRQAFRRARETIRAWCENL